MEQQFMNVGRRKTAVAVAILKPGNGKITINGKTVDEYFGNNLIQKHLALLPLKRAGLEDKVDVEIKSEGGGITGQADAIKLAIARCLVEYKPELRTLLKKESMLKRDPRMVERKKAGQPKARKKFQWTKR